MNDTINTTKNDLRTLIDTRFDRVEQQMKVFQNTLRGAGNVIQYDPILNNAGAPLPLPPITSSQDLIALENADVSTWYRYYFPEEPQVAVAIAVKKIQIARYIGCNSEVV
ncbi:hypothetical protein BT96DRAFT_991420 [Gymnopus androsaceus JB14]|uniref:Mug135-like C-terminal domain-containing protein n=1 Tax=Gymnopus androsaceus JB14 TaxID=1447944 RepID=A0A6A4HWG7_9AGAR|nr:hypothetical protein BT96DRAFT_991420 [Gymnopus androsaceus JB14]